MENSDAGHPRKEKERGGDKVEKEKKGE